MKTISLRKLLREPRKVKRLTRSGKPVHVTDHGQPLWIIQPATTPSDKAGHRQAMEGELAEILHGPRPRLALSEIILDSRR